MRLALVGFALGTALVQVQANLPATAVTLALALIGLALLAGSARLRQSLTSNSCTIAGAVLLGFAWAAGCAAWRMADALPTEWEGRDVQLTGVVASLPQPFERGVRFEFEVEQVATTGARVPRHLQLSWYSGYPGSTQEATLPAPQVHPGERWILTARLRQPHGNANPHGFDYEAWLLERGIRATGYVRSNRATPAAARIDNWVWSLQGAVDRLRERIRDHLQAALGDAPYGGVIIALAIGDQRAIDREDWQVFARTGVSHLMSISGLHVTMVASLGAWLVWSIWRFGARRSLPWVQHLILALPAPQAAALGGFLTALTYCMLAGFAIPAQRTLYMLGVAAWALWRGWFGSATRVLALALAVVCLLDPWAALSAGFWLSFGAVALLLFAGQAQVSQRQDGRVRWLRGALGAQLAITVGLVPLTLALFQQVSLVGPLANAIAIPLVSLVITPLALLAAVLPFDAIALLAHALQNALMAYLEWLADLPWAVWQHADPPLAVVVLGLGGALWLLIPWWWSWRALGAVWMLPLVLHVPPQPAHGELSATVLDVGQGLAVVVRTNTHTLLFDTGPAYSPEADGGNRVVLPFLRGAGISRIDAMLVSHDDSDHTGGALSVLDGVPIDWVGSPLPATHPLNQSAATRARPCTAGQSWVWDGVRFEILNPPAAALAPGAEARDNALSCVLKVSTGNRSLMLPADIERDVEARLLTENPAQLKSDVLIAPHHGSRTSSTAPWIAAVGAQTVIFPVGYRNRFRHPADEVVQRYRASGARLIRTDQSGAVTLRIDPASISITEYRAERRRYWYAGQAAPSKR